MEDKNKILAIRDTIMLFLSKWGLNTDECKQILQMCRDEVEAMEKRRAFGKVRKDEE